MAKEIKRNTPRDLFLHLLAIVTLYWSAITFVGILWQFINKLFPDVLQYGDPGRTELIRFFVSSCKYTLSSRVFILVDFSTNSFVCCLTRVISSLGVVGTLNSLSSLSNDSLIILLTFYFIYTIAVYYCSIDTNRIFSKIFYKIINID